MESDHSAFIDRPKEVREGEEIDLDQLRTYLAAELPEVGAGGEIDLLQFPSGHSNLTYLVRVGARELVLRRPPVGAKIKTAHDMGREYRILCGLQGAYPKAPGALLYCEDEAVIGAPFYLMERVQGVILRGQRPPKGLRIPAETMRPLSTALIDNLAQLHAVDLASTGLADEGRPEGYVKRQIEGWTRRYVDAKTDEVQEVEEIYTWLAQQMPKESVASLIHGDYKYDNLVLDPDDLTDIVAVLDWEMATVGDPLMDLGTSLGYWIDPSDPAEHKMLPLGPTLLEGNLTRTELVARYAETSGRDLPDPLFYYVYGLFKIVVIAQQIYKRFKEGLTKDPRFASMILGVQILARTAARAIERGRIHDLG
jgi:aminoglycoside phosphotransferase (APT) family kinase protein